VGLIYLDACIVIYVVEEHPVWGAAIARAFEEAGLGRFAISALTKMECLVGPLKHGDAALHRDFLPFFERLNPVDMAEQIHLEAAELRARFGLRTPDALHLACARHHRCDALWTNDGRFSRASGGLARNVLGAGS
jgi:predicted nucleic acid-binding protein